MSVPSLPDSNPGATPGAKRLGSNLLRFAASYDYDDAAFARGGGTYSNTHQQRALADCLLQLRAYCHYPNNYEVVKMTLAAVAANFISGPVWLMLVGPSRCGKTTLLNWLVPCDGRLHRIGKFSEAGLLSIKDDKVVGYLPDVIGKFGIMLVPEFAPILAASARSTDIVELLRQLHDGVVPRTLQGAHIEWYGKCGMLAACAPGIDDKRNVIAAMGERFVYYRLQWTPEDVAIMRQHVRTDAEDKAADVTRLLRSVLQPVLDAPPPRRRLSQSEQAFISDLALFTAAARAVVVRDDSFQENIRHVHAAECDTGLYKEFSSMFDGALAVGVPYDDAITLLRKLSWSSIPAVRATILRELADKSELGERWHGGTKRIAGETATYFRSARHALEELAETGLLERQGRSNGKDKDMWRLSKRGAELYANAEMGSCTPEDGIIPGC